MKKTLLCILLFLSTIVYSQDSNKWSLIKPYSEKRPLGISSFNLGTSYLATNYSPSLIFNIDVALFNIYFSYGSNFKTSPENVYGEGNLTNSYKLESLKLGYCISTNKFLYFVPFLGIITENQLYSDAEYGKNNYGNKYSYFNTGISLGASFKYLDIRFICGIKEIGLTFGLNFENL